MINKKWTVDEIKQNLRINDTWVYRGIVAIYNLQTIEEKDVNETTEQNGVGFNGVDANILSSFANQIISWENSDTCKKYRTPLSKKQLTIARKKIIKYSKQLAKIANNEL
jgi:hypothetical protein